MTRLSTLEITDGYLPADVMARIYRDLSRTNRWIGNRRAIIRALRQDSSRIGKVLDIGCGDGAILLEIERQLGMEVVGVDLRPPGKGGALIQIIQANAVMDDLPRADVAICVLVTHHLAESEFIALIRNVRRNCRRLIILDLVRNWLPLALFRLFVAPFGSAISAADGCLSVRRAYTACEFRSLVGRALAGTHSTYRHTVAPFYIRQVADISYAPTCARGGG